MKSLIFTLLLLFVGCKSINIAQSGFDLLGNISEQKLKQLLKAEAWQFGKDSLHLCVVVERAHTQKVLGNKIATWFTREGQASLTKRDLKLSLEWSPKDSTQVRITLKRYKYGISSNFR
jgi:hypothetical protein